VLRRWLDSHPIGPSPRARTYLVDTHLPSVRRVLVVDEHGFHILIEGFLGTAQVWQGSEVSLVLHEPVIVVFCVRHRSGCDEGKQCQRCSAHFYNDFLETACNNDQSICSNAVLALSITGGIVDACVLDRCAFGFVDRQERAKLARTHRHSALGSETGTQAQMPHTWGLAGNRERCTTKQQLCIGTIVPCSCHSMSSDV
jgi:hypothetical protein